MSKYYVEIIRQDRGTFEHYYRNNFTELTSVKFKKELIAGKEQVVAVDVTKRGGGDIFIGPENSDVHEFTKKLKEGLRFLKDPKNM